MLSSSETSIILALFPCLVLLLLTLCLSFDYLALWNKLTDSICPKRRTRKKGQKGSYSSGRNFKLILPQALIYFPPCPPQDTKYETDHHDINNVYEFSNHLAKKVKTKNLKCFAAYSLCIFSSTNPWLGRADLTKEESQLKQSVFCFYLMLFINLNMSVHC